MTIQKIWVCNGGWRGCREARETSSEGTLDRLLPRSPPGSLSLLESDAAGSTGPRISFVSHSEAVPRDQAMNGAGLSLCGARKSGIVLRDVRFMVCIF